MGRRLQGEQADAEIEEGVRAAGELNVLTLRAHPPLNVRFTRREVVGGIAFFLVWPPWLPEATSGPALNLGEVEKWDLSPVGAT
jgi:hypothetical protein